MKYPALLVIVILLLCSAACRGDGGDDYGSDYIHVVRHESPGPDGFGIKEEFAALLAAVFLAFSALKSMRRKPTAIMLIFVIALLFCAACQSDGGNGGESRETLRDMRDVYYVMGEGFGQKEFAALVAAALLAIPALKSAANHSIHPGPASDPDPSERSLLLL